MMNLIKKPRKPRTKKQKDVFLSKHCPYDDDTIWKECNRQWSYKCDGNIHKCMKLKMHHLASLSEKKRKEYLDKELELTRLTEEISRKYNKLKETAK